MHKGEKERAAHAESERYHLPASGVRGKEVYISTRHPAGLPFDMNIMLVSVTERTGEIGIRKALGAAQRMIRSQFLVESVTLSLTGGLLGLLIGTALSAVAVHIAGWTLFFSAGAVMISLGFSLIISVFFGWYPAAKAARLEPMEALQRD